MAPPTLVTGCLSTLVTSGAMREALLTAQCAMAIPASAHLRLLPPLLLPRPATILVQAILLSNAVPVELLLCIKYLRLTSSRVTL